MRLEKWFIGAAIGWAAALPLATLIAAHAHTSAAVYMVGLAIYAAGSIVCHQLPDRTFHLWSAAMPVCARCTGIYAGAAIAVIGLLTRTRRSRMDDSRAGGDAARRRLMAAALPTAATVLFEWSTGLTPSNVVRALAGLPLGAVIAWVIGSALAEERDAARPRERSGA